MKPKFNEGETVKVEFMGNIKLKAQLRDGSSRYCIDNGDLSGGWYEENQLCPLEKPRRKK